MEELDSIERKRIERALRRELRKKEVEAEFLRIDEEAERKRRLRKKRKIDDLKETQEKIIKETNEIEKLERKLKKKVDKVEELLNKEKNLKSILKTEENKGKNKNIKWNPDSINSFWSDSDSEENKTRPLTRRHYGDLSNYRKSVRRSRGPCEGYGVECQMCTDFLAKKYMLYLKDDWEQEKQRLKDELSETDYERAEACASWLE
jgi:DNA repair exonuclease SbcCD ATPase subunit